MINRRPSSLSVLATAAVGVTIMLAALVQPARPQAQAQTNVTPTPSVTPTRSARAYLVMRLRGVNTRSPDGAGSDIKATVLLPAEGVWAGRGFEFQRIEGSPIATVEFTIYRRDPNSPGGRVEVYRHVERNPPWCPFGDANGVCNPIPVVNGQPTWPDSDDAFGSGRPVQPGDYVMEVIATGVVSGSWRKREAEDNAIYFSIDTTWEEPLPPLSGRAAIAAPRNGITVKGVVVIRGTATANNFSYYKFELLDPRCEGGVCFLQRFDRRVVNGVLWRWDTRQPLPNGVVLPNGTWTMQLVVVDRWERPLPNKPTLRFTVSN
ncbi:MAG: hypothetical protein K6U78_01775 [Anaerolineae bacterium]|nr:hypothetical protein [Anaerolineae bacterium]